MDGGFLICWGGSGSRCRFWIDLCLISFHVTSILTENKSMIYECFPVFLCICRCLMSEFICAFFFYISFTRFRFSLFCKIPFLLKCLAPLTYFCPFFFKLSCCDARNSPQGINKRLLPDLNSSGFGGAGLRVRIRAFQPTGPDDTGRPSKKKQQPTEPRRGDAAIDAPASG